MYLTADADAYDGNGLWQAPSGRLYTRTPLLDSRTGLYARLNYAGALRVASRLGMRLLSVAGLKEVCAEGYHIVPVLLPSPDMRPPRFAGETDRAYEIRCRRDMSSIEWARVHDERARAQLTKWDGERPVMNMGKWWIAGAPFGRSYLAGWYSHGDYIQPIPLSWSRGPHNDRHTDYGTLTMLEKEAI